MASSFCCRTTAAGGRSRSVGRSLAHVQAVAFFVLQTGGSLPFQRTLQIVSTELDLMMWSLSGPVSIALETSEIRGLLWRRRPEEPEIESIAVIRGKKEEGVSRRLYRRQLESLLSSHLEEGSKPL